VEEIRGNVDTRLRKLEDGTVDALVLAYAGLKRLGLTGSVTEVFNEEKFYPAPGQGAIAVECRRGEAEGEELVGSINHPASAFLVVCERAFLRRLEGGCQLPCGITSRLEGDGKKVVASGILFSLDGTQHVEAKIEAAAEDADAVGLRLAEEILFKGGEKIIREMRNG
jgi:hydroxymethylbilane synthase